MKLISQILMAMFSPWTSRKLWMSLIALLAVNSLYWTSVYYLYSFTEPWQAEIFYKMFSLTAWTTTAIVLGYLGLQSLMSGWTQSTVNTSSTVLNTLLEHKIDDQNINIEKTMRPKDFDDESIA